MRSLINIILIISFVSCTSQKSNDIAVARLDNKIIWQSEIDSVIAIDIYNLRLKTIKTKLETELIKLESKKLNISVDSFTILIKNSRIKAELQEKENEYIQNIGLNIDTNKIHSNKIISDSLLFILREGHTIKIFLPKLTFKSQAFNDLYSYNWIVPDANESVIVIFNYDCPICTLNDEAIKQISKNYKLNLKYIYYTDYVMDYALLCDAALNQNKYWEMHDRIISSGCNENINSLIIFADSLGMDTIRFEMDFRDKRNIKPHLINKEIIQKMNIYSVPTYIYKNSIFHDIETLEMVLQAK